MKDINLTIIRGDDVEISDFGLKLLGDYSSETIYFTVKEKDDLNGARYVDVAVTSIFDGTYTRFSGAIAKELLQSVTFYTMVWDLVKDGDVVGLISGEVYLKHRVRSDFDTLVVSYPYRYLRVKFEAGVVTEEKKVGFSGTLTYSVVGNALTITSSESGDFPTDIFITPNQQDCNYYYISDSEIQIIPNDNYGVLMIKITKEL